MSFENNNKAAVKVSLLLTGNELMSGDIVDSNSAMLAERLGRLGSSVFYKATIGDDMDLLVSEIKRIAEFSDVLIVNGGLGPTVDDLTAEALAQAMDVPLAEHEQAVEHLVQWCGEKNIALNEANRKQAMLPSGIDLIANKTGSAVGFKTVLSGCEVYCTPGVPYELKTMFIEEILPVLPLDHGTQIKRHRLRVFGMGESGIQQRIKRSDIIWPATVELGFRASMPLLEVKLQAGKADDYADLEHCYASLKELFGHHVVTEDSRSIAHVVLDLLLEQGKKVCFAESCTGGLIAASLTELSGASQVFDAGFVTYSNAMKESLLGVNADILEDSGAVSEDVVRAMLSGALQRSGADLGVSVSGVAGPNGGSEEKPVGTVWLAWGSLDDMHAHPFFFPVDRKRFQVLVSALAFDLLRRQLMGSTETAVYFKERQSKSA